MRPRRHFQQNYRPRKPPGQILPGHLDRVYLLLYVLASSQKNKLTKESKSIISNSIRHRLNTLEPLYYKYFINLHSLFTLGVSNFFRWWSEALESMFRNSASMNQQNIVKLQLNPLLRILKSGNSLTSRKATGIGWVWKC